jgi:hypothetical protein
MMKWSCGWPTPCAAARAAVGQPAAASAGRGGAAPRPAPSAAPQLSLGSWSQRALAAQQARRTHLPQQVSLGEHAHELPILVHHGRARHVGVQQQLDGLPAEGGSRGQERESRRVRWLGRAGCAWGAGKQLARRPPHLIGMLSSSTMWSRLMICGKSARRGALRLPRCQASRTAGWQPWSCQQSPQRSSSSATAAAAAAASGCRPSTTSGGMSMPEPAGPAAPQPPGAHLRHVVVAEHGYLGALGLCGGDRSSARAFRKSRVAAARGRSPSLLSTLYLHADPPLLQRPLRGRGRAVLRSSGSARALLAHARAVLVACMLSCRWWL